MTETYIEIKIRFAYLTPSMKQGYKIILIIIGVIVLSELIHIVPNPPFVQKYVDKLNAENRAEIEAAAKFATKSSNHLPANLNFFGNNPDIKFDETLNFINRSPVSKFTYNGKYKIAVCRLDSPYIYVLNKTINQRNIESNPQFNVYYAFNDLRYITFEYNNNSKLNKSKNIFINIDGSNTKVLTKNDSIAYYSSNINTMSIQYGANGPQDLFVKSTYGTGPIEILFLKRNNSLYALFMSAYNLKDHINPYLLLNLTIGPNKY